MEHYIIPYNFEAESVHALAYAQRLATKNAAKISLLYIAKDTSDQQEAEAKFAAMNIDGRAVVGNLLEALSIQAQRMRGSLVVMASRKGSGLQKLLGSTALKVITDSKIPFLIIQQDVEPNDGIQKIGLTIDSREESTQILSEAIQLCTMHSAALQIICAEQSDSAKQHLLNSNLNKMVEVLRTTGVHYSIERLERNNFEDHLLAHARKEKIDLFAVTYYKDNSSIFSSNFVKNLLENKEGIPVLAIGGSEIPAFRKLINNMVCPVSAAKIDSNISRITVFINVLIMIAFLLTYDPIYAYIVTGDYLIRAFINGKFSPIRFFAEQLVKLLQLKPKRINLAPKIFASRLGFLCTAAAVLFYFLDNYLASIISMGMLTVLSFMDSVINICVGCIIYNYLVFPFFKFKN